MFSMRRLLLAATVCVASVGAVVVVSEPASANTLTAEFTFLNTAPNASGGSITFELNANGTIKATLTSTVGEIFSFGFNSNSNLSLLAFSPSLPPGFDTFGLPDFKSGFSCNGSCLATSISWTIGGTFASVFDVLNGPADFDFFMVAGDESNIWNANAVSQTPLPAALPLFATVLGGAGLIAWRRKRKAARASNLAAAA